MRSHKFDETAKIQVKERYPFTAAAGMTVDSITVDPEQIKKFIAGTDQIVPAAAESQAEAPAEQEQVALAVEGGSGAGKPEEKAPASGGAGKKGGKQQK